MAAVKKTRDRVKALDAALESEEKTRHTILTLPEGKLVNLLPGERKFLYGLCRDKLTAMESKRYARLPPGHQEAIDMLQGLLFKLES